MTDEGRDYDEVLAAAQAAGYAEADPAGDVEGHDAVNKLVVLARLAFGVWLDPADVVITTADGPGPRPAGDHRRRRRTTSRAAAAAGEVDQADRGRRRGASDGRVDARRSSRRSSRRTRRSGEPAASSTGSRSTPSRSGPSRSAAPAPAERPRRARSSATCWRLPREAGSTWASLPPARTLLGRRRMSGVPRERRRRGRASSTAIARSCRSPTRRRELTLGEGFDAARPARSDRRARSGSRTSTPRSRARTRPARSRTAGWSSPSPRRWKRARRAIICASTGNTSASAAAYGAHAGLEVVVVLPRGQIATGQAPPGDRRRGPGRRHRRQLRCGPSAWFARSREQDDHPVTLVNSVNPYRLEGQKTAAFEICDDLGRAPDVLAIPVGNAGNISAYWAGFREYAAAGIVEPRGRGCSASRRPARRRSCSAGPSRSPRPSRRRSGSATPRRGRRRSRRATRAAARSRRCRTTRSSPRTGRLAVDEGIFCEPSSATSVAGVTAVAARGGLPRDALVVCVLTGSGLKDPATAESVAAAERRDRGRADGRRRGGGARMVTNWLAELDGRRVTRRGARRRAPTSALATTAWRWRSG